MKVSWPEQGPGMQKNQGLLAILITGTSHVGKTTLSQRLSGVLGCEAISTDNLGRHPGRPWPMVRPPVAEFYQRLAPETIYWFMRVHHDNMWPGIRRLIEDRIAAQKLSLFEGSALRPEFIAPLVSELVTGICLYADAGFLRERMMSEAGYDQADEMTRAVMDKFIARSLQDNAEIHGAAKENGMRIVNAADVSAIESVFDELIEAAS